MRWAVIVLCDCGWFDEPSFGNKWFTETSYPICPDCGRDIRKARKIKAQLSGKVVYSTTEPKYDDIPTSKGR